MKKLFICAIATVAMFAAEMCSGQTVYPFSGSGDTVKTTAVKNMNLTLGSPGPFTVQFTSQRLTDSVNAVVDLEGSIDGVDYARIPNTDTVIVLGATVSKLWFIKPDPTVTLVNFWRLGVKPSKATGQAIVRGKILK